MYAIIQQGFWAMCVINYTKIIFEKTHADINPNLLKKQLSGVSFEVKGLHQADTYIESRIL